MNESQTCARLREYSEFVYNIQIRVKMEEEIIIIGIEQATKTAQGSGTTTSAQKGEATPTLSNVSSGSCCLYRGEP